MAYWLYYFLIVIKSLWIITRFDIELKIIKFTIIWTWWIRYLFTECYKLWGYFNLGINVSIFDYPRRWKDWHFFFFLKLVHTSTIIGIVAHIFALKWLIILPAKLNYEYCQKILCCLHLVENCFKILKSSFNASLQFPSSVKILLKWKSVFFMTITRVYQKFVIFWYVLVCDMYIT